VILAALPGMVKVLLESGKLAKPGNSCMTVNPLGSQLQVLRTRIKRGLRGFWTNAIEA
jgi:hypothetical protein